MDKQKILIVDDDENIAELISLYLTKECFDTGIAADGEQALKMFKSYAPDLVLLDIMLPGIDGYEVLTQIRKESNTPVIMLSAKGEVFDKVLGLKIGADDYIIKPFDSNELVARVRAVLRRTAGASQPVSSASIPSTARTGEFVEYDNIIINLSNYTVLVDGKVLEMPPKELELLYFLASKPNQVFTREQILDRLWGYEYIGDTRTVDVHVKRLREKLPQSDKWNLGTVWGIGYKFEVK
ncbi:MAG: response regulator transcription factor [Lachnospiraceae bacterium]|nr:response regulator transcription factor [Lachnospiraceae bacterium]